MPRMRLPSRTTPIGRLATALLSASVLLPLLPTSGGLEAQMVRGVIVERGSERPLGGAWIALVDSLGVRVNGTLADADGSYLLAAPAPGSYTLETRLIGYEDTASPRFVLAEGSAVSRRVEIPVRAVTLAGIEVGASKRCGARLSGGEEIARLWEEARKALEILEWTEANGALRYGVVRSRRALDAESMRVLDLDEQYSRGVYDQSPYISIDPDRLIEGGYVQEAEEAPGEWDYFAPDATVLLSDSFLETHCFAVAASSDDDRVGLAFSPVEGREVPDIEGVLWLDRASGELRTLDFTYVGLPFGPGRWEGVGGQVEFERLATGVWVVRRWHVRMPMAADRIRAEGGARVEEVRLRAVDEQGARVVRVETLSGETLSQARGATLYGEVVAEGASTPLADAVVDVIPTGFRAVTAEPGAFRLEGLPEGRFEVQVTHPLLERLGSAARSRTVDLTEGRATRLAVEIDLDRARTEFCREAGIPSPTPRVVYGTVRTSESEAGVPGIAVRIRKGLDVRAEVTTAGDGGWAACLAGVAEGDTLDVAVAVAADGALGRRDVVVGPGGFAPIDLEVAAEALRSAETGSPVYNAVSWTNGVVATVFAPGGDAVVDGASAVVRDASGAVVFSGLTDSDGRFRFVHDRTGPEAYSITVQHPRLGSARTELTVRAAEELAVEVTLGSDAAAVRRTGLQSTVGMDSGERVPIVGRVVDTSRGVAIPAARVAVLSAAGDTLYRAEAESDGRFVVFAPRADSVTIGVEALGYRGATTGVVPEPGMSRLEVGVAPSPIALGGLTVTVEQRMRSLELGGFYDRQRGATGDFLDLTNLDLPRTVTAVQMVSRLSGVSVQGGREPYFPRTIRPSFTGRRPTICYPVIVVDGQPVRSTMAETPPGSPSLERFTPFAELAPPPELIAAIEVYQSSNMAPPQWRSIENECGVIVIWTQR